MKKEIEIDVDGVLANLDGSYAPYIMDIIPDYTEEKYITGWDMPLIQENYPEAFKRIKDLWVNPEFIRNLEAYPNVDIALNKLYSGVSDYADIVIHTHIRGSDAVCKARYDWINKIVDRAGIDCKIEISTDDTKKSRKNSFIVVEDNVNNLKRSSAENKILIRCSHNRDYNLNDVGEFRRGFIFESFYDSVPTMINVVKGVY